MKEYKLKNGVVRQYIGSEESINYIKKHSSNEKWKWHIEYHSDSLFIFDKIEYVLELISIGKRKFYIFKDKNDPNFSTRFDSLENKLSFNDKFGDIFFEWLKTYGVNEEITKAYNDLCDKELIHLVSTSYYKFEIKSFKINKICLSQYWNTFSIDVYCENDMWLIFTCGKYNKNGVIEIDRINRPYDYFSVDYNEIVSKQQELLKNKIKDIDSTIEKELELKNELMHKLI